MFYLFNYLLAAAWLLSLDANAEKLPLWEAGGGIGVINFQNYRGTTERTIYLLPVPYFVYRGQYIQIDRQNARGIFYKSDEIELDISFNGSVPVRSRDNAIRAGMPDANPTFEIGPVAKLAMVRAFENLPDVSLRLPIRPVLATDFHSVKHVGWIFQPQINVNWNNVKNQGWNIGMITGPIFADKNYHQYFYGVDPAYSTVSRPAYFAGGGYSGFQFLASISKRYPEYWVGGYLKYDYLNGAVFADSPLVNSKQAVTFGFAATWIFSKSKLLSLH